MGVFNKAVVTEKGQALLAKSVAGLCELQFTKIALSEATLPEDVSKVDSIGEIKQFSPIANKEIKDNVTVAFEATFVNTELTTGYRIRNIGLYAMDPDEGEILYSVSVADESKVSADWMPPYDGMFVKSLLIELVTAVSNAPSVNVVVDPTVYATVDQVTKMLNDAKKSGEFDGKDGYTPIKGVDYYTEADKTEFSEYIVSELAKRGQLKPEFANSIAECTDTSKLYVLPDGYIYAYMYTEVKRGGYTNHAEPLPDNTTDTSKWVNGYRFSSSDISAQANTSVSNIVTCKKGDVIRITGVTLRENTDRICVLLERADGAENITALNYFNQVVTSGSKTVAVYDGLEDGIYTFTMSTETDHTIIGFRFAMPTPTDAGAVIVTVNEEIAEEIVVKEYAWTNTKHAFVPNDYDEEFVEINKTINQLDLDIEDLENANAELEKSIEGLETEIENIGETKIPDYWQEHIAERITAIKNLHKQHGKDCFSFVVLADTHYPANLGKISPLLAKKIMDNTDIKYAIHVGDWQTRGCHKTKEELLEENEKIDAMFAPISNRLLMQQGNHDGAYGLFDRDGDGEYINKDDSGNNKPVEERETYVHNLTHGEMHEYIYRKVGMVGNVHFDRTGTAYYIDDTSNNVRYVGLNTQCNDYELQADGTQKYPKMWLMRFTQSQFDFLINKALKGLDDETKVVLFGHVPLTQEIGDRDVMIGVLKAFKNKTTYNGNYAGEYDYDAVSVNVDFTGAKGTLVGYFHGHIHSDSLNTTNGFPIIGTRSDAVEEYTAELRNERVFGTITEQSFNVFTVTPTKIFSTKIGAGIDREISY